MIRIRRPPGFRYTSDPSIEWTTIDRTTVESATIDRTARSNQRHMTTVPRRPSIEWTIIPTEPRSNRSRSPCHESGNSRRSITIEWTCLSGFEPRSNRDRHSTNDPSIEWTIATSDQPSWHVDRSRTTTSSIGGQARTSTQSNAHALKQGRNYGPKLSDDRLGTGPNRQNPALIRRIPRAIHYLKDRRSQVRPGHRPGNRCRGHPDI
jgi:hypothetical protein